MISESSDGMGYIDAEDEKDLENVNQRSICRKLIGFLSFMILLVVLVFVFIHLVNNGWKFDFSGHK